MVKHLIGLAGVIALLGFGASFFSTSADTNETLCILGFIFLSTAAIIEAIDELKKSYK